MRDVLQINDEAFWSVSEFLCFLISLASLALRDCRVRRRKK
jgi:hypothetical protein